MTGQYEALRQRAGELGCDIHNATDTVGLLHCIHETQDISGGRKEELIEFLIHLLACKRVAMNNTLLHEVREAEGL